MAMSVGGDQGGVKSDINVTPLVDVMLVLLIIMMLVAPMLQKGADVKLPSAANTTDKPDVNGQAVVAIKADVYVDYATVMETMDNLRSAGIEDMGLITEKKVRGGN